MKKLMQLRARANGNKFIFTIVIRTVRVDPSVKLEDFEASVSIHRGSNLVETKIQPIMNKKITWNETFEILCTLYRTKEGDFQEKIAKIQLRGSHESYSTGASKATGPVLASAKFDLTKAASTTFEGKVMDFDVALNSKVLHSSSTVSTFGTMSLQIRSRYFGAGVEQINEMSTNLDDSLHLQTPVRHSLSSTPKEPKEYPEKLPSLNPDEPSFPGLRGTTRYKATTGNSVSRDSLEIEEEETNSPFTPDESAIEVVQNLREPVKVLLNPREMRELKKSETLHEADEAIAKTKMHHHYEEVIRSAQRSERSTLMQEREIDHLKGMIEKCKAEIYHRDKIIQGLQLSEYNLRLQVASLNSRMSETARQENGASETNLSHDIQEAIASETERLTLAYLPVIRDLMKELEDTRFHQQYR
mmetsp:Transcript_9983/g.33292  ORF Transcript_9983/g.33292 Transcript_9983/m.33292 type:complete len:416 (-) Transcript_9983:157-1404(-)